VKVSLFEATVYVLSKAAKPRTVVSKLAVGCYLKAL